MSGTTKAGQARRTPRAAPDSHIDPIVPRWRGTMILRDEAATERYRRKESTTSFSTRLAPAIAAQLTSVSREHGRTQRQLVEDAICAYLGTAPASR